MNDYVALEQALRARGVGSYLQNPDQLVISNANPAMPDSNTFWITKKNGAWYLATWLPAVYQVPLDADVCELCYTVLKSATKAIYRVEDSLAEKLKLRRLTETEIETLGF